MTADNIWKFILSLTAAFPAIVGALRLKKIDISFRPFIVYVLASAIIELIVGLVIIPYFKEIKVLVWNCINLFEATILLLQFYYWKRFQKFKKLFFVIFSLIILEWIVENFVVHNLFYFNSFFLISYSFLLVLLSVQTVNYIIVNERRFALTDNPKFIICVAMIIFFIYNIFVYTLMAKGIRVYDKILMGKIFAIQVYINAFANILYGLGVYLIPKKAADKEMFPGV